MSKRTRSDVQRKDRIVLDVGGTEFTSSISTLTANSTYFAALFSRWDDDDDNGNADIFLDRDADAFAVLLSCMRHKRALLPHNNTELFKRVLLDAQFLGMGWLETEVKARVFDHTEAEYKEYCVDAFNRKHMGTAGFERLEDYGQLDADGRAQLFDCGYQSIDHAFERGYLPAQFFDSVHRDKKIKQLIPCPVGGEVIFYDEEHSEFGRERRKAICLALMEDWHGHCHIEPVVRGRGIVKPAPDRNLGAWLTTAEEDQLVPASQYIGHRGEGDDRHWAYAYSEESDEHRLMFMDAGGYPHLKEDHVL